MSTAAATVVLIPAVDALVKKLKRNLLARQGATALIKLARAFSEVTQTDHLDDSSATCSIQTARDVIRAVADMHLSDAECGTLLAWLDRNGERTVTPSELLAALRVQQSPLRRSVVARLWTMVENTSVFDKVSMTVPADAILQQFSARSHPAVLRGQSTAEAAKAAVTEFFYAAATPCGMVSRVTFEAYYATEGASIPRDAEFAATVAACWGLPSFDRSHAEDVLAHGDHDAPALKAAMTVDAKAEVLLTVTLDKAFDELIAHHRKCLATEKPRAAFRALGCALRAASSTGFISVDDFIARLADSRLYVAYKPVLQLLDTNGSGTVDYKHYLHALVGELPPTRKVCAERLWRQLPRDGNNCVPVSEVHKRFLAGSQPSPAELALFLDSWDMRKQHGVTTAFELLCEWFVPLSATIEQDSAFIDYLTKQWGLKA